MPLYVYACESCGHNFERRQSFGDAPLSECPECGGKIRRVVQPVGIVFKGSGFYKTDSRNSPAAAVSSGERKPEGSSEAGADNKPAPAAQTSESAPAQSTTQSNQPAGNSGSETKAKSADPA